MDSIDRHAIAGRVRRLVGGLDPQAIEQASRQLGVSEWALRLSIDPDSPQPTIEVILAIVRAYGVDPAWLLTGDYDSDTHRFAENDREASIESVIERVARKTDTPAHAMLSVLHGRQSA